MTRDSLQSRTFEFSSEGFREDGRIPVVISTDAIVTVQDGPEILVHSPDAVDLTRAPIPIIATHRSGQLNVGVVEDIQFAGGKMRGMARFGARQEAIEIAADVGNKILRSVSVGYARINGYIRKDGVLVTTRWMPTHAAIVAEPADVGAGFFRSAGDTVPPFDLVEDPATVTDGIVADPVTEPVQARSNPAPLIYQEIHMSDPIITIDESAVEQRGRDAANKRIAELMALGDQFREFGAEPMVKEAMAKGESTADFTARLMKHISESSTFKPQIGMSASETRQFSITRAVRAMMSGDWSGAGLEREASKAFADRASAAGIQRQAENSFFVPYEVQRRDMTVGTAANGGNMVATELRPQDFIGLLRSRSLLMDLGARMLSGLVGNADITKHTAGATGYWLANEATAITESQATLGLLQLRPKVLGAYTEVSRLLLQQSTPDADAFIMEDLAGTLATSLDVAGFVTGGSGAPVGILGTSGIGAFTGTSLALPALMDAQVDVATANALNAGCAYVTTPAVASLLAQRARIASTDSVTLWKGNILDGNVEGFRAASSTNIPAATMIFGDFSQVIVAEWGALEIASNPYANFAAGITGIRAFHTVDVGVRVPGAFSAATTIT
jgi:HK97 family phage major capsid protein